MVRLYLGGVSNQCIDLRGILGIDDLDSHAQILRCGDAAQKEILHNPLGGKDIQVISLSRTVVLQRSIYIVLHKFDYHGTREGRLGSETEVIEHVPVEERIVHIVPVEVCVLTAFIIVLEQLVLIVRIRDVVPVIGPVILPGSADGIDRLGRDRDVPE